MSEELKPCPFCGSNPIFLDVGENKPLYEITCLECDGAQLLGSNKDELVKEWNTRPIEEELRRQLSKISQPIDTDKFNVELMEEYVALRTENARLREALVDISHGCLVPPDGGSPTFDDLVDCARKALAPQIEEKI